MEHLTRCATELARPTPLKCQPPTPPTLPSHSSSSPPSRSSSRSLPSHPILAIVFTFFGTYCTYFGWYIIGGEEKPLHTLSSSPTHRSRSHLGIESTRWVFGGDMHAHVDLVYGWLLHVKRLCVCRCGAWMFVETLIHFRFGKFLYYPYVLPLGEVMPNFSALCIPLGEVHACVCMCCGSNFPLYVYHLQESMVLSMSSAWISRYKIDAKEDMIRNNMRQIRCPCRSCKLERWINPDSGQLEEHLLRRGFMQDNHNCSNLKFVHILNLNLFRNHILFKFEIVQISNR